MTIEDRGDAVGAMRSSTSCGMVMRSSAALALSPLSIVTAVQRRPASLRATAVNTCVPIGFSGSRIVTGTSMVVSNTSPPPSGGGVELRFGVGPGGVELGSQIRGLGGGLLLEILGLRLGLVGLGGGEHLVG